MTRGGLVAVGGDDFIAVFDIDSFDADALLTIVVRPPLKKEIKRRFSVHPINSVCLFYGVCFTLLISFHRHYAVPSENADFA